MVNMFSVVPGTEKAVRDGGADNSRSTSPKSGAAKSAEAGKVNSNEKDREDKEECHDLGVEAESIGDNQAVVFAVSSNDDSPSSFDNKSQNGNHHRPPSLHQPLPPQLRSPVVGYVPRTLGEISPMPPSPSETSRGSPSTHQLNTPCNDDEGTETTLAFINDNHVGKVRKTDVNAGPSLDTTLLFPSLDSVSSSSSVHGTEGNSDSDLGTDEQCSTVATQEQALSNDQDNVIAVDSSDHWCSQFCALALQNVTEVCSDMLSTIDEVQPCSDDIADLNICTGSIFACYDTEEKDAQRKLIQFSILSILGSSSQAATSWFEGNLWNLEETCQRKAIEPEELQRTLRNRAAILNAQARRLRRLRNEMTFLHAAKTSSQQMRCIGTTKSMDECSDNESNNDNVSTGIGNRHLNNFQDSYKSQTIFANDADDYYDSDPGEMKHRTSRGSARRASIEHLSNIQESEIWSNGFQKGMLHKKKKKKRKKKKAGSNGKSETIAADNENSSTEEISEDEKSELDLNDDEVVAKFIQEITNGTMTLVWHPTQTNEETNISPICVNAWIELGCRMRDTFVQPKLMWRAAYEPKLERKKLSTSGKVPHSVDLLDIFRIYEAKVINRDSHPFAKKSSSFLVETTVNSYLFETISEDERNRIVFGLKLLVARLASQLIVGDSKVYEEFFTPTGQIDEDWRQLDDASDLLLSNQSQDERQK